MALTPADVHAQQFTTVRMRTGYDMDEVDAFLDVVEAEIARLLSDNDDLRAQLTQAQSRVLAAEQKAARGESAPAAAMPAPRPGSNVVEVRSAPVAADQPPAQAIEKPEKSEKAPAPKTPEAPAPQTKSGSSDPVAAPDAAQVSSQALAMLEIAQRTADETVSAAKAEASQIVTKAQEQARTVTADLDEKRVALEKQVGQLRTFERNYRIKLRDHIAAQLAEFDAAARVENVAAQAAPEALVAAVEADALPITER